MQSEIYTFNAIIDPCDVGENNLLTNQAIFRLLQKAASLHSSSVGYGVSDIPTTHLAWIILNWKLRVFSRPNCNSEIIVKTWCNPICKIYFYRDFEICDRQNNIIAIATSKWILLDTITNSICRDFTELIKVHSFFDKKVFGEEPFEEKIKEPTKYLSVLNYNIQRRDVDTNHHVNNLHYLDYSYEVLPNDVYYNLTFNNVEIMYKHEAKLGSPLSIYCEKNNPNCYIVSIKNENSTTLHALIKLYV